MTRSLKLLLFAFLPLFSSMPAEGTFGLPPIPMPPRPPEEHTCRDEPPIEQRLLDGLWGGHATNGLTLPTRRFENLGSSGRWILTETADTDLRKVEATLIALYLCVGNQWVYVQENFVFQVRARFNSPDEPGAYFLEVSSGDVQYTPNNTTIGGVGFSRHKYSANGRIDSLSQGAFFSGPMDTPANLKAIAETNSDEVQSYEQSLKETWFHQRADLSWITASTAFKSRGTAAEYHANGNLQNYSTALAELRNDEVIVDAKMRQVWDADARILDHENVRIVDHSTQQTYWKVYEPAGMRIDFNDDRVAANSFELSVDKENGAVSRVVLNQVALDLPISWRDWNSITTVLSSASAIELRYFGRSFSFLCPF